MKKTLIALTVVAFALNASALSFQWAATGVSFGGNTLKNSEDVTGYLIYLGNGGSLSTSYAIEPDATAESIASSIGSVVNTKNKTSAVGKLQNTYTFDFGGEPGKNGDVFALLIAYTDKTADKTYVSLSSSTMTLAGLEDDTSSISNPTFSMSYSDSSDKGKVSSGGGWTAVPEPSTAALALAGLALLLKRRKA